MTNLLVVILHDTDRLGALLDAWDEVGVPGVTIFSSIGGYQARGWLQKLGLGSLAQIFDSNGVDQRTLMSLIDNDQLLEKAISTADHIVKGFDSPRSGILFTLPVGKILGLQKWGSKTDIKRKEEISSPNDTDKGKQNLIEWLRVTTGIEPQKKYGAIQVAKVLEIFDLNPAIVKTNDSINEVLLEYQSHSSVPIICVINSEHHLVGIINFHTLVDAVLAPYFPDEYLNNPKDYETLLQFSELNGNLRARDLQVEPICINKSASLSEALHEMRKHGVDGLTVVDDHYHIAGYINMMSIISSCVDLAGGTPS